MTENGYIICHKDMYLSRKYIWRRKDVTEHAYMFPWWQTEDVLCMAEKFELRPTHLFAATFDKETGTVIVGERFDREPE